MNFRINLSKEFITFILIGVLIIVGYYWFIHSEYFLILNNWAQKNIILFLLFITSLKFLGIVYPPIAGGLITLGSVPIVGWQLAFLADSIGTTTGGIVNYFVAKKYGIQVVKKLVGREAAAKVEKIKIKKGKEIEGIVFARIFFGTTLLEVIHYACGIFKIDFKKYLVGLIISQLVVGIPIFYFFSDVIMEGNIWLAIVPLVIALPLFYKYRTRYFDI